MKQILSFLFIVCLVFGLQAAQPVKKTSGSRKASTTKTASSTSKTKGTSKKAKKGIRVVYTSAELRYDYDNGENRPLLACFYDCTVTGLKGANIKSTFMIFNNNPESDLSYCERNKISFATYKKQHEALVDDAVAEFGLWGVFAVDDIAQIHKLSNKNDAVYSSDFSVDSDPYYIKNSWCGLYNDRLDMYGFRSYYAVMVGTYDRSETEKDIIIGHSKIMEVKLK